MGDGRLDPIELLFQGTLRPSRVVVGRLALKGVERLLRWDVAEGRVERCEQFLAKCAPAMHETEFRALCVGLACSRAGKYANSAAQGLGMHGNRFANLRHLAQSKFERILIDLDRALQAGEMNCEPGGSNQLLLLTDLPSHAVNALRRSGIFTCHQLEKALAAEGRLQVRGVSPATLDKLRDHLGAKQSQ